MPELKDQKGLKLSATNQPYEVDAARLNVGNGNAIVEVDAPRDRRSRYIRRTRPEVRRNRVGKIGRGDAWTRSIGIDQGKQFAPGRQPPVGVEAEIGGVHRGYKCLGVAQATVHGGVAGVNAIVAGIAAVGAAVAVAPSVGMAGIAQVSVGGGLTSHIRPVTLSRVQPQSV